MKIFHYIFMRWLLKVLIGVILILIISIVVFLALDKSFNIDFGKELINKIKTELNLSKAEAPEEDNRPLEAEVINEQVSLIESFTMIAVKTNKPVTLNESNRLVLKEVSRNEEEVFYVIEVTTIPIDDSVIKFTLSDAIGNSEEFEIALTRESGFSLFGKDYVEPWEGSKYILEGDDLLANVNKSNRLLNTYEPSDLVNLFEEYKNLYVNTTDFELRAEAAEALSVMINKLVNDTGKNVLIVSAYRSYNTQASLYASYLRKDTQENVDTYSARPGYSEHQLGTAVDMTNEEVGFQLEAGIDETITGKWLTENSYKYGFIKSYPKNSDPKKSYGYESWHYRYVGIENAKAIHESGMIPTEWMEQH